MALTARAIAVAALDLADRHGSESLTMERLASSLHRRASSLYNHIDGRDDLIERMRAIIVESIDTSSFAEKPWDEALIDWAESYLAAFAARPNSIRLLATTPITDPSTLQMYDTVIAALTAGGWPAGDAVAVMRTVEAFNLGSALDVVAPSSLLSADAAAPELQALRNSLQPEFEPRANARAGFDLGLRALLHGLRAAKATETNR